MFRSIRRKDRAISKEAAEILLRQERRGILAVNGDDDYPYAIPVNFLYDEKQQRIYFHGAKSGYKVDAIQKCDKICFTVYGNETIKDLTWAPYVQSVIVFGKCHLLDLDENTVKILKQLAMKYFPDEEIADREITKYGKAVQLFEITIEHMTAKQIQEK